MFVKVNIKFIITWELSSKWKFRSIVACVCRSKKTKGNKFSERDCWLSCFLFIIHFCCCLCQFRVVYSEKKTTNNCRRRGVEVLINLILKRILKRDPRLIMYVGNEVRTTSVFNGYHQVKLFPFFLIS